VDETKLRSSIIPRHVVELNHLGSNQFLEGPASGKPAAPGESILIRHIWWKIVEGNIAYSRIHIPLKHGVDRFDELCAARFVDTTCIEPYKSEAMFQRQLTVLCDLAIPFLQASARQGRKDRSWDVTSPSPHVCERIAYGGIVDR
jgi:hypothetical protein